MRYLTYFIVAACCVLVVIGQPTPSDHCLTYNTDAGTCQACIQGFYLQIYFCLPCAPLCKCTGKKENFCESCLSITKDNYTVNAYKTVNGYNTKCNLCFQSMPHCASCSSNSVCTECYDGYYLLNNNTCSSNRCTDNCTVCQTSSTCKVCQPGYQVDSTGVCNQLSCAVTNCLECNNTDPTQCSTCQPENYLQPSNNTCQPCMDDCLVCKDSGSCDLCSPGFVFQQDSCQDTGLSNCISYSDDYSTCLECEPNYYMDSGSCNQCTGCDLCKAGFICDTQCQDGYQVFNFNCIPSYGESISRQKVLAVLLVVISLFIF